jgi:hypothetical protein
MSFNADVRAGFLLLGGVPVCVRIILPSAWLLMYLPLA